MHNLPASLAASGKKGCLSMECTVNWIPAAGMAFAAETGSGHVLMMDGAPDGGGRNLAPRPLMVKCI